MMRREASGPSPPRPDPDNGMSCWDSETVVTTDVHVLRKVCRHRGRNPRDPKAPAVKSTLPEMQIGALHGTDLRLNASE